MSKNKFFPERVKKEPITVRVEQGLLDAVRTAIESIPRDKRPTLTQVVEFGLRTFLKDVKEHYGHSIQD